MLLEAVIESMKRKLLSKTRFSPVKYEAVKQEEIPSDETHVIGQPKEGNGKIKLCGSSKKRFYFFLIVTCVVLLWIGIYYKLLNHRFQLPEPFRELRRMFGDGPSKNRRKFRESETENVETVNIHNTKIISIVVVACNKRLDEAVTSLKSATLFTKYHLDFHIFTDKKHFDEKYFDNELSTWPAYQDRWMMFYVYPAVYPDIIQKSEKSNWQKLFKPCASLRLFLTKLLPEVDSVIYLDTDTLFLRPPEELWSYFQKFSSKQVAGLVNECDENQKFCWYKHHAKHPYVKPYGVNSGVMLMNLTRLRKMKWENELITIYSNNKEKLRYGDQDILNIFFHSHFKYLYKLPCEWNYRPDFCFDVPLCDRAVKHGIGVLHGCRSVFHKSNLQPEFYTIYKAFHKYEFDESVEEKIVNKTKSTFLKKFSLTSCGKVINTILKFNTRK